MITSAHNPKVQIVRSLLGRPKERRLQAAFVVEGVRLVEEALATGWAFRFALHTAELSGRGRDLVGRLKKQSVEVDEIPVDLMQSLGETETSQGILAVLDLAPLPLPEALDFVLVPDRIRDPGNLGALLRTAAAAGVQAALLPPETTDAFAPKVLRAGMGAHFRLPVLALGWEQLGSHLKGLQVFLAEARSDIACWQANFRSPLALIVGGEAEGASTEARRLADQQVCIPMPGESESLNAASAGAILMFEVVRQRQP